MHYVYILRSKKDKQIYIGCTNDLDKRFKMHNNGMVESTKFRRPLEIVCYEAFSNINDAFARDKWLKTGWGRSHLQKKLHNTLKSLGG